MSDISRLQAQLAHAEEQLMIADTMDAQVRWGDRCDQLEAAIADALVVVNDPLSGLSDEEYAQATTPV